MQKAGTSLSRFVTLPLLAAGAGSVYMAAKFDQSFAQINALAGKLGVSIDKAREHVLALAQATGRSPQELAQALYFIASAGLKASLVMGTLDASAKAASAGMGTAQEIAQTLTSVLNAYAGTGLDSAKAMDIMTQAVKKGKAELSDFATGLGPVITTAAKAGVSFGDLTGTIAQLTNVGVPFSRAVTGMRFMIGALWSPTKAAVKALADIHINANSLAADIAKPGGLVPTLQMVHEQMLKFGAKGRMAWREVTGGARGAIAANALVGNSFKQTMGIVTSVTKAGTDSVDQFGIAVKKATDNPMFRFRQDLAKLEVAAIRLGEKLIPVAEQIATELTKIVTAFERMSPKMQSVILKAAAFGIVLGPALTILGSFARILAAPLRVAGWVGGLGKVTAAAEGAGVATAGFGAAAAGGLGAIAILAGAVVVTMRAVHNLNTAIQSDNATLATFGSKSKEGAAAQADLNRKLSAGGRSWAAYEKTLRGVNGATQTADRNHREWFKTLTHGTTGLRAFDDAMKYAHGITQKQAEKIALLSSFLYTMGGRLGPVKANLLQAALASGDFARAQKILNDAINRMPPYKSTKISTPGAKQSISDLQTLKALLDHLHGRTLSVVTKTIGRPVSHPHTGGIIRGAAGFVTTGPTYLVGEGSEPSAVTGKTGSEAVLPLDSRGIGILAKAITLANQKAGTAGKGIAVTVNLNAPVYGVDDLDRQVNRSVDKAVRRALALA
jgi:TP901 family phage tail tape measure protein